MHSGSKHIILAGASVGIISIAYFGGLVAGLPFWLTGLLIIAGLFLTARALYKPSLPLQAKPYRRSILAQMLLLAGAVILTNKAYYIATKYGVWDAWAIWNLHATYLADAAHWKNTLRNTVSAHPDYPLALPATLAFFFRLLQRVNSLLISHGLHFFITLAIPILIFLETYRKSIIIAGLVLILFATNEFYIAQGVSQLADTLLAFFLLCAMVCMAHHADDSRMLVMAATFAGLCMWTKNEGVFIAVIFCLFHMREFFGGRRVRYTVLGFALPFIAWAIFKLYYAPPNDMVAGQSADTRAFLMDGSRYKMIYDFFIENVTMHFKDAMYGVLIYILLCVIAKRYPDKRLTMIFAILLCYMMIYVVSPHDLKWHLFTSQSRLLHQLMPATLYVLAQRFSGGAKGTVKTRFFSTRLSPR